MDLVEIFDDGERLRQHVSVVERERRNEPLRIEREIVLCALTAHPQMDERPLVGRYPFQVERDPHAVCGGRPEVVVESHRRSPPAGLPKRRLLPRGAGTSAVSGRVVI
jgi:hypothetical protein